MAVVEAALDGGEVAGAEAALALATVVLPPTGEVEGASLDVGLA